MTRSRIASVRAWEALDSRGRPTGACEVGRGVVGIEADAREPLARALRALDSTPALERLGANAILAVSVASALAAAAAGGLPLYRRLAGKARPLLPLPMLNVVSGGAHAGGAVDFQDFLVVPIGASNFAEAIEWAWGVRAATA